MDVRRGEPILRRELREGPINKKLWQIINWTTGSGAISEENEVSEAIGSQANLDTLENKHM